MVLHEELDKMIQQDIHNKDAKPISCKKGCSFCCHRMIHVTTDEAALLTSRLEEMHNGTIPLETITELESRASSFHPRASEQFWELPYEHSRCTFLGSNKECKVYENRPASCRLMNVTSDPKYCSKQATKQGFDKYIMQLH